MAARPRCRQRRSKTTGCRIKAFATTIPSFQHRGRGDGRRTPRFCEAKKPNQNGEQRSACQGDAKAAATTGTSLRFALICFKKPISGERRRRIRLTQAYARSPFPLGKTKPFGDKTRRPLLGAHGTPARPVLHRTAAAPAMAGDVLRNLS